MNRIASAALVVMGMVIAVVPVAPLAPLLGRDTKLVMLAPGYVWTIALAAVVGAALVAAGLRGLRRRR